MMACAQDETGGLRRLARRARPLALAAALPLALAACNEAEEKMPANVAAGEAIFNDQCAVCHNQSEADAVAPDLAGVVGREAGSWGSFVYSTAMADADFVWNDETLDAYLKDPMGYLPGTNMGYFGLEDDTKRAELIAYLNHISP